MGYKVCDSLSCLFIFNAISMAIYFHSSKGITISMLCCDKGPAQPTDAVTISTREAAVSLMLFIQDEYDFIIASCPGIPPTSARVMWSA
jgi:hypothetical protein